MIVQGQFGQKIMQNYYYSEALLVMKIYNLFGIFVFSMISIDASEKKLKTLACAIKTCKFQANTLKQIRKHRFTHTKQRPYTCDSCGVTGFKESMTKHFKKKNCSGQMQETILTEKTRKILDMRLLESTKALFYRCGINGCSSKSHLPSKIVKHRWKKHVSQKKYTCSLCLLPFNSKKGIAHQEECSQKYKQTGKLLPYKLYGTVKDILKMPMNAHYLDGKIEKVENVPLDDVTEIEFLDDDADQIPLILEIPQTSESSGIGSPEF